MTIITSNLAVESNDVAKSSNTYDSNSIYDQKYYLVSLFNKPKYQAFFNEDYVGYFADEYLKELTREHPESEKLFRESQIEELTKFANGPLVPKTLKSGIPSKDKREAVLPAFLTNIFMEAIILVQSKPSRVRVLTVCSFQSLILSRFNRI